MSKFHLFVTHKNVKFAIFTITKYLIFTCFIAVVATVVVSVANIIAPNAAAVGASEFKAATAPCHYLSLAAARSLLSRFRRNHESNQYDHNYQHH